MRFIIMICFVCLFVSTVSGQGSSDEVDMTQIEEGKKMFKTYCKSCHHLTQRLTGPPLLDVASRRSKDWIVRFVQSSQSVIKSGDAYADSLYLAYNSVLMPDQPLSESDVDGILTYFDYEKAQAQAVPAIQKPKRVVANYYLPLKFTDVNWWLVYTLFFFILIWGLYTLIESHRIKNQYEMTRRTEE